MAVVIGPLHSSEARGAVGGLVYNSHRGRAYVKANTPPKTQYSPLQISTRLQMTPARELWPTLSDADRAAWNHFALSHVFPHWTGSDLRISGWNWFCKINYRMTQFGLELLSTPPTRMSSLDFSPDLALVLPSEIDLAWVAQYPPPDPSWHVIFFLAGPHSAGRSPSIKMAKQSAITVEGEGSVALPISQPGYYTVFWLPVCDNGISAPGDHFRVDAT